jgi:hypothetical protein
VTLTASTSDPAATFRWDSGETTPQVTVTDSSVPRVTVVDSNGCTRSRSWRVELEPLPTADAGPDADACGAARIGTPAFPFLDYSWDPPDGLSAPDAAQPWASPAVATTYTLTVTDTTTGCRSQDQTVVTPVPAPGVASGLLVGRAAPAADLLFSWSDDPAAASTRVYSEVDRASARGASGASATAVLRCEGALSCRAGAPAGPLVFFQAVGVCAGGAFEGPN